VVRSQKLTKYQDISEWLRSIIMVKHGEKYHNVSRPMVRFQKLSKYEESVDGGGHRYRQVNRENSLDPQ
jgi:hypothetical protein